MSYLLCKLPRIDSAKYPPKGLFCATATPFHRPPPASTPSSGQKHGFAHNRSHPWNGSAP